jgi:hypothetical protein
MAEKSSFTQHSLNTSARILTLLGALVSLVFMFNAGHNQKSVILMILFTIWVLAPFVGLFLILTIYNRWKVHYPGSIYWLMIIISIGSMVAYSGLLIPSGTKAAFIFLVFPFVCWLMMAIFLIVNIKKGKSGI